MSLCTPHHSSDYTTMEDKQQDSAKHGDRNTYTSTLYKPGTNRGGAGINRGRVKNVWNEIEAQTFIETNTVVP